MTEPASRLPYRLLTGTDDRAFCEKVSAALREGYRLHGGPTVTFDGRQVVAAQAVVLDAPDAATAVPAGHGVAAVSAGDVAADATDGR